MCSDGRYTSIYECYESCRRNVPRDGRRRKTRRHWSEPTKFDHFYLLYCELDRRLLSVAVSIDGEWIIYCLARNYRREHGGAVRSCPQNCVLAPNKIYLTIFWLHLRLIYPRISQVVPFGLEVRQKDEPRSKQSRMRIMTIVCWL